MSQAYCNISDQLIIWQESLKSRNSKAAFDLCKAMSAWSEAAYFARWMDGLEYTLWAECHQPQLSKDCQNILSLSQECGGWWVWSDESDHETFLPINEWLQEFEKYPKV